MPQWTSRRFIRGRLVAPQSQEMNAERSWLAVGAIETDICEQGIRTGAKGSPQRSTKPSLANEASSTGSASINALGNPQQTGLIAGDRCHRVDVVVVMATVSMVVLRNVENARPTLRR